MSDELREAIYIGVELILFSIILTIILFMGNFSREAYDIKKMQDVSMTDINEYRKFYEFTLGKEKQKDEIEKIVGNSSFCSLSEGYMRDNGNIVTGDDIIRFIGKYPYEYDVYVSYDDKIFELNTESSKENWSSTYVSSVLGEIVNKEFYSLGVFDSIDYCYDSIIFKLKKS